MMNCDNLGNFSNEMPISDTVSMPVISEETLEAAGLKAKESAESSVLLVKKILENLGFQEQAKVLNTNAVVNILSGIGVFYILKSSSSFITTNWKQIGLGLGAFYLYKTQGLPTSNKMA
jgi:hypothetical protein